MKKCRIIKREWSDSSRNNSRVEYTIQQKHFLFRWWWVDAWVNSSSGAACTDTFSTYKEALDNLKYFDGSKAVESIVYDNQSKT